MRFAFLLLLISCFAKAQGTFRIYDAAMNDVTGTNVFVWDTSSSQLDVLFYVQNTDSVAHNVRAGRNVIVQPVGAANAFIWNQLQYAPPADSSLPEPMSSSGLLPFEALFFPNN